MGTINLDDLEVFVAVADSGSFSAGASRLRLPRSSVSRAIARLEEAAGSRVLYRTTRKVALSTAGRALYENVLPEIVKLRRSLGTLPDQDEEPSGRLRMTASLNCEIELGEAIARYLSRYRAVEVEVHLTNDYVDLVAEGIDLALRYATRRLKDSSLTARKLCGAPVQLFAAPSYLARQGTPRRPQDLDRHEWVVHNRKPDLRLEGGGRPVNVVARGRVRCDDFALVRAALVNGCGIGYLEAVFAEADLAAGKLVRVLPRWHCVISDLWALWPGGRQPPRKVTAFLEVLEQVLAKP